MSSSNRILKNEVKQLSQWFEQNSRPLPWRKNRNPYEIWISEVMLQQTTVKAVIPFFKKFIKRFPNIKTLANAPIEEVYTYWAGLGYYSRARNIHKAAKQLKTMKNFPKTHNELAQLPGFGDYTSRAVTSQAFAEKVGVVDGNVIRVLSRRYGMKVEHWKSKEKAKLQELADNYAQLGEPSTINQAFMELGATLCTPKNPTCLLCPIKKQCVALKKDLIENLPLRKPKKAAEIWVWQADLYQKNGCLALIKNHYAPFLKDQWMLPGKAKKMAKAPEQYDFQHAITHHKIYVQITRKRSKFSWAKNAELQWIPPKQLKEKAPFSLVQKAVDIGLGDKQS